MNRRDALTLIELLLVLAVLASAACMVLPNLFGTQRHMQLRAQAAEFANQLRNTRQFAIDQATSMCVGFNDDGTSYWRHELHHPSSKTQVPLAYGITLHAMARQPKQSTEVVFHPDGSASACQVEVRADHGSMLLNIERLTGNVTLEAMP